MGHFAQEDGGKPAYGGIRYGSRFGDYECWAIFEGAEIDLVDELTIEYSSPGLAEIEPTLRLKIR